MTLNRKQNRLRQIAKDLKLGVLIYRFYYAPKGFIEVCFRWGAINMALTNRGKRQMEKAVFRLKTVEVNPSVEPLKIYFLSGKKYWYQTCFCAYSMMQKSHLSLQPIIYDDGTLEQQYQDEIIRIFPNANIVSLQSIEAHLDEYLPKKKFPFLRERRLQQPLLRKLTDFHVGSSGWKLFLDSDMLFFKTPTFLLNWLQSPQQPCYMVDLANYYGYSNEIMVSLTQSKIPDLVNIGILGLKSEDLDWEKFEFWLKTLLEKEGTHYNITQGMTAMFLADKSCAIAPSKDYLLMPNYQETLNPKAILHHYVADSKPWYFRYAWKHIVSQ